MLNEFHRWADKTEASREYSVREASESTDEQSPLFRPYLDSKVKRRQLPSLLVIAKIF